MAVKKSGGWWKWIIILLILGTLLAAGVWYFKHEKNEVVQYQVATVERGDLTQAVTATGTLNPVVNVTVGSQVSGRISKLNVDYNSIVKSNEIIAEIDPANYQAALQSATADLANAQANLELQQVQYVRTSELYTNMLVSGSDYDVALASLHQAEATVKIKQASLNNALVNLNYCQIVSPVDGVVISRAVELGQTVASSFSTPTLFQIANDLTKMQIDANVAEADVGGVEEGQEVDFTVDAYPFRTFKGVVTQVRNAPLTVNNVVTYDCVIGVNNADQKLKPGMTANVSIVIASREGTIKIPNSALRFRPSDTNVIVNLPVAASPTNSTQMAQGSGGNTNRMAGQGQGRHNRNGRQRGERQIVHSVYVLAPDSTEEHPKMISTSIKTGISDGINTEVTEGLKEGDRVVTGTVFNGTQAPAGANPFGGGGMPRMR
ncbi:MAG: efflux RND transporter periplasmic adaptor subunit [Limisphaerales bacterium]